MEDKAFTSVQELLLHTVQKELKEQDKRLDVIEDDIIVIKERLQYMSEAIAEIRDNTKWLRRTLTSILATAALGGIVSLIIWLIQT